jgi:hypothetical protein
MSRRSITERRLVGIIRPVMAHNPTELADDEEQR